MRKNKASMKFIFFVALAFLGGGCTNIDFREPVSSYNKGMIMSGAVLSGFYSSLNNQARDNYLLDAKYDPEISIDETFKDGSPTPLVALFPPEAIKVRIDSIGLITKFGERLAALAGSDAPEIINTGVVNLGSTYANLASSFDSIKGGTPEALSKKYVQPISAIVGILSEEYMDAKRDTMLKEAVDKGSPAVDKVLILMEGDIPLIHQWVTTKASEQLSTVSSYYRKHRREMSLEQRSALLNQISVSAKHYQDLLVNSPTDVVIAMRDVNAALKRYADNPKDDNRIIRLTSEIETFNDRVAPFFQAYSSMRSQ